VNTQARTLLLRVERLPCLLSITSTVYLWLAYPIPTSIITNSVGLDTADQRLDRIDF
jgi:hypothetical protein